MKRILYIFLFIIALVSGFFLVKPAVNNLSAFLSKTEKVNGNVLIVEGWLSNRALETAINEFRSNKYDYIITTGLKATSEYYNVSMDGYLIFYPEREKMYHNTAKHTIEVKAYSELEDENSAHFILWVNNRAEADFYADRRKRKYRINWQGSLSDIDSVMIQFDNDKMGSFGDRNLFVKEIIFDKRIRTPFLNFSEYDITDLDGKNRIVNNLRSNADQARRRLFTMGMDSSKVISVPGEKVKINRTLTSAIAVRDWLKVSGIKLTGINIISEGTHARRTWMTFNRVLNAPCKIGVISLTDYKNISDKRRILKTFRETAAIIYYWIILLPY